MGFTQKAEGKPSFQGPSPGEKEEAFMGRCMEHMLGAGKAQDQATAICLSMWRGSGKAK